MNIYSDCSKYETFDEAKKNTKRIATKRNCNIKAVVRWAFRGDRSYKSGPKPKLFVELDTRQRELREVVFQ